MVRNLGIMKIMLSFPILLDQWMIGPLEVNNIAKLITAIGIIRIINRTKDINKSKKRFI
jgi:hypothetical protein|tara:strand:+ start:810 stop:986 length:177 start_codon:yes stop_codon:yes gene_type:complete